LQALQSRPEAAILPSRLEDSVGIVDRTLQQVRTLSLDLRPSMLDDLGLVAALRSYIAHQAQRAGFVARFVADPFVGRLRPDIETTCFRIVQEALTNVIRHAQAQQVCVELRLRDEILHLVIQDTGIGFDLRTLQQRPATERSMGMLSMQERVLLAGGWLDIQSAPGSGTAISVQFPLGEQKCREGGEDL
jgi:signal transduction histidine kinase